MPGGPTRRDDADEIVLLPITVDDHQHSPTRAQTQQDETILRLRVVWVIKQEALSSLNTVWASSKVTPCLRRLRPALAESHSKRISLIQC